MSDNCEQYCPAYGTCIEAFDASSAIRESLLKQRQSMDDIPGLADAIGRIQGYASQADMTDEEIDALKAKHRAQMAATEEKLEHRIAQNETALASAARSLMEADTAQTTCPGPKLSFLGKVAVGLRAIRQRRRPTDEDRSVTLEYFAKCSSAAAKAAMHSLPEDTW